MLNVKQSNDGKYVATVLIADDQFTFLIENGTTPTVKEGYGVYTEEELNAMESVTVDTFLPSVIQDAYIQKSEGDGQVSGREIALLFEVMNIASLSA